jgi:2-amino-4-hydroxy-6-hydroxymethyldihydropteridine diphosphokinase
MHQVFLGIGGNIGNKRLNFNKVHILIEKKIGNIIGKSSIYETPPWGFLAEEDFWNQVLHINTDLSPEELMEQTFEIEMQFGRKRDAEYYVSREMDIDVLYFDDLCVENEVMIIPHPRIPQRLFVLIPLAEIAPAFIHPVLQLTNRQLLEKCIDESSIKRIEL